MTVVASFRIVYLCCRVFGLFPYEGVGPNEFRLKKSILKQARTMLGLIMIVRLVIVTLDVNFNLYSIPRTAMTICRVANTSFLHVVTIVLYTTLNKHSRSTCTWLNQTARLFSSLRGNTQCVLDFHRLITCYNVTFFSVTNVVTLIQLWTNAKFISGWTAFSDSLCFVLLLSIQNVYLYVFLTMMNLARVNFARINEILREKRLQREREDVLRKTLRELRAKHLTVTAYLDFLKSVFGFYLLMYIIWSSLSTLFGSISVVLFDLNDGITLSLWIFYHPLQNLPMLYICTAVVAEAKKSVNLVHELFVDNEDPEIKEQTEIFSLQLQHRSTEFSVCGFFNLNFKFYISITGAIATYIVALIQIHPTQVFETTTLSSDNFTLNS